MTMTPNNQPAPITEANPPEFPCWLWAQPDEATTIPGWWWYCHDQREFAANTMKSVLDTHWLAGTESQKPTVTPVSAPSEGAKAVGGAPRTDAACGEPTHDWEAVAVRLCDCSMELERELAAQSAQVAELTRERDELATNDLIHQSFLNESLSRESALRAQLREAREDGLQMRESLADMVDMSETLIKNIADYTKDSRILKAKNPRLELARQALATPKAGEKLT